jgi:predicted HAD superfamily Cof-like phosphohydrolase
VRPELDVDFKGILRPRAAPTEFLTFEDVDPTLTVSIKEAELQRILRENRALNDQVTALQARGTELVEENRILKNREKAALAAVEAANKAVFSLATELARVPPQLSTMVGEFHAAMGVETPCEPVKPDRATVRLRARLILEEVFEFLEHVFVVAQYGDDEYDWDRLKEPLMGSLLSMPVLVDDMSAVADDLCDIAYVTEGAFQAFGMRSGPLLAEVQRSNMSKAGAPKDANGKVTKGPNYSPPDMVKALLEQGWQR